VEVQDARRNAAGKLARKRLDALCLCSPAAFEAVAADYRVLRPGAPDLVLPAIRKERLARLLVALVEDLAAAKRS
jgi:hypothetical protein